MLPVRSLAGFSVPFPERFAPSGASTAAQVLSLFTLLARASDQMAEHRQICGVNARIELRV
jgi:hypothetical protein